MDEGKLSNLNKCNIGIGFVFTFDFFHLIDFQEASYRGGGNITFKGTLEENTDLTTRIFQGKLLLGAVLFHITHSGIALQFSSTANE
uniref:Uncharacterized protein n=1 Tax=Salix viminalis TaxID=40686 RepID=A0A6N2NH81_SALVM